ncbi:hypothetical protein KK488_17800 [Sphingobium sp. H33]|uniref:Uncharacterized protein n=2 Tax=Sphingobium nicotianae TaxID=2782607 RepID=A0A9X1DF51_9SPHN|nr:hypothetical protein [Sphingobium nicotianae]
MTNGPGLDDHHQAQFAWARFRRIMWGMAALALGVALAVVALLWALSDPLPWIFVALIIGGVWATVMMAALLMGLMFLSSGTGHDHHVHDRVSADVLGEDD